MLFCSSNQRAEELLRDNYESDKYYGLSEREKRHATLPIAVFGTNLVRVKFNFLTKVATFDTSLRIDKTPKLLLNAYANIVRKYFPTDN